MKYTPPIGGAANDPYVDVNPATGVDGSIVPAAAIEGPQRELHNLIEGLGGVPDPENYSQLVDWLLASFANIGGNASQLFRVLTANQFDDSTYVATTAFVRRAMGSAAGHATISGNTTLTAAHAGKVCFFSAAAVATLPLASSCPAGTLIHFCTQTSGAASVLRQGTDTITASSAASTLTSLAILDGETLTLESNGSTQWVVVDGTAALKFGGGFGTSLAGSGYQKLPSGLIIQWGAATSGAGGSVAITYPIAFPSGVLFAASFILSGALSAATSQCGGGTTTGNTLYAQTAGTVNGIAGVTLRYLSIGY